VPSISFGNCNIAFCVVVCVTVRLDCSGNSILFFSFLKQNFVKIINCTLGQSRWSQFAVVSLCNCPRSQLDCVHLQPSWRWKLFAASCLWQIFSLASFHRFFFGLLRSLWSMWWSKWCFIWATFFLRAPRPRRHEGGGHEKSFMRSFRGILRIILSRRDAFFFSTNNCIRHARQTSTIKIQLRKIRKEW